MSNLGVFSGRNLGGGTGKSVRMMCGPEGDIWKFC